MQNPINIISLGAGVQSSAMALMACHGMIKPMPELAIFADTGDEPKEVYLWLRELCRMLTFPVVQLRTGPLSEAIVNKWGFSQIPTFIRGAKGATIGRRQCSKYFKILPVRREIRQRYPDQPVTLWIGISSDEYLRAKESERQWLTHRFPLLEADLPRSACVEYLKQHTDWKVPKSACVYCPYKDRSRWQESQHDAAHMAVIERVEAILNPRGEYLTSDLKPISHINFDESRQEAKDRENGQINMFNNECEGVCGV